MYSYGLAFVAILSGVIGSRIQEIIEKSSFQTLFLLGGNEGITSKPKIIVNNITSTKALRFTMNSDILTVIFLQETEFLDRFTKNFDANLDSKVLMVLSSHYMSLQTIAEKCWNHGIMMVSFFDEQTEELYSYKVSNKDVTVIKIEKPELFRKPDIQGFPLSAGGEIFQHFAVDDMSSSDIVEALKSSYNIKFKLENNPNYFLQLQPTSKEENVTPFLVVCVKNIVILPKNLSIEKYLYFVKPFTPFVWFLICLGIFYNSIILTSVNHKTFSTNWLNNFGCVIAQSFTILKSDSRFYILNGLMIMFGLIVANLYSLYLGAFMVTTIKESEFQVISPEPVRDLYGLKSFENIFSIVEFVDVMEFCSKLLALDSRFGFHITEGVWDSNLVLQDNFMIDEKLSRESPVYCFVKKHSAFRRELEEFLFRANSFGLMMKWLKEGFFIPSTLYREIGRNKNVNTKHTMSSVDDFKLLFYELFFGTGVALIVFFVEIISK